MTNDPKEVIIQPNVNWFYVDWKGILNYRDLLFLLVRRDFLARYKQTVLGPAWFILQPLLTTLVFTVVFGKFTRVPTDSLPPMLFYMCGLLAWTYFATCLNSISLSLVSNSGLYQKVYFPRLIIPLSILMSNLLTFALQLATFLCFYFYFKWMTPASAVIQPTVAITVLPLLVIQTALIALGVGLWVAALTVRYRDFHHLVGFMTQLWMYATPIIYPASNIPGKWRGLLALNPMAGIVESYRYAFFGVGWMRPDYLVLSGLMTLILVFSGLVVFNRVERTFVDTI